MQRNDDVPDPSQGILILLLIWLSILVIGLAGSYLKLLSERGCV